MLFFFFALHCVAYVTQSLDTEKAITTTWYLRDDVIIEPFTCRHSTNRSVVWTVTSGSGPEFYMRIPSGSNYTIAAKLALKYRLFGGYVCGSKNDTHTHYHHACESADYRHMYDLGYLISHDVNDPGDYIVHELTQCGKGNQLQTHSRTIRVMILNESKCLLASFNDLTLQLLIMLLIIIVFLFPQLESFLRSDSFTCHTLLENGRV